MSTYNGYFGCCTELTCGMFRECRDRCFKCCHIINGEERGQTALAHTTWKICLCIVAAIISGARPGESRATPRVSGPTPGVPEVSSAVPGASPHDSTATGGPFPASPGESLATIGGSASTQ